MKIRSGFVSNSSSSSFCLYGMPIDDNEFYKLEDSPEWQVTFLSDMGGISDYCDKVIIGLAPWKMAANETRLEFETRVQEEIKKVLKTNKVDCEWCVDGGYNG